MHIEVFQLVFACLDTGFGDTISFTISFFAKLSFFFIDILVSREITRKSIMICSTFLAADFEEQNRIFFNG